jgi:predicted regulator of Ras-like GTPase activity (Roadblock/LC7/MglB family)
MPYDFILARLLAQTEGAAGVIFLDDSGETVDLAVSDFTPFQMKILGAYLGIHLRQLGRVLETLGAGPAREVHIEREHAHVYAVPVSDGYSVALVQHRPGLSAVAQLNLHAAARELEQTML